MSQLRPYLGWALLVYIKVVIVQIPNRTNAYVCSKLAVKQHTCIYNLALTSTLQQYTWNLPYTHLHFWYNLSQADTLVWHVTPLYDTWHPCMTRDTPDSCHPIEHRHFLSVIWACQMLVSYNRVWCHMSVSGAGVIQSCLVSYARVRCWCHTIVSGVIWACQVLVS